MEAAKARHTARWQPFATPVMLTLIGLVMVRSVWCSRQAPCANSRDMALQPSTRGVRIPNHEWLLLEHLPPPARTSRQSLRKRRRRTLLRVLNDTSSRRRPSRRQPRASRSNHLRGKAATTSG